MFGSDAPTGAGRYRVEIVSCQFREETPGRGATPPKPGKRQGIPAGERNHHERQRYVGDAVYWDAAPGG